MAVFSPHAYPERIGSGKANTVLVRQFVEEGWDVTMITSHPLYPCWKPARTTAQMPGVRFLRGGQWLRYPSSAILRRAILELWFAWYAAGNALRIRGSIEVAVSVYPPSLFAMLVHLLLPSEVEKISVVHDLQGVYSQRGTGLLSRLLTRAIHAIEGAAFRSSDRCIFFSSDIARVATESYRLDPERVFVQYPFVTLTPQPEPATALAAILPEGRRHVVYSGAMGEKQNPELLAEFFARAAALHPGVDFHIFSAGPKFESIRARHQARPGNRIHFRTLLPERNLAELYRRCDVQVVPQAPGTETGSLPSKLPNLLATGVHLIALCPAASEVCTLLRSAGTATFVPEWTEEAFLAGLSLALEAAARETHAQRAERARPLLPLFRVSNLTRLVTAPAGAEAVEQ
jgi:glycosyltransferase involved in cell wall biosynthesis